jgi:tetratricopeptide (TPR) repeat protein
MIDSLKYFCSLWFVAAIVLAALSASANDGTSKSKMNYDDLRHAAMELKNSGNQKGALTFFDKAVRAAPNNPEGYLNRGAMYGMLRNYQLAIKDEQRALATAAGDSEQDRNFRYIAHINLAGIYLNQRKFVNAEHEARASIRMRPDNPMAHELLGAILKKNGKLSESLAHYLKAQESFKRMKLPDQAVRIDDEIQSLQSMSKVHRK